MTQENAKMEFKRCSRFDCNNPLTTTDGLLPISEFNKDKSKIDGHYSYCKNVKGI